MQTFLGLDLGTYSLKAVVLKISFEVLNVEEVIEIKYVSYPNENLEYSKLQALKESLNLLENKFFDSIYTTIGCDHTVLKKFELNNVKRGDRQKIIESEFDLMGIFNLDDYTIEYHTINFDKNNAKLLAFLIHKTSALQLIENLKLSNLNVRIIDIDNMVYLNSLPYLANQSDISAEDVRVNVKDIIAEDVRVIVNIGHSKTFLTVTKNYRVIYSRVIAYGGLQLTNLIKDELKLTFEEAENLKHQFEFSSDGNLADKVLPIINLFYEELSFEIKRSLLSFNSTSHSIIKEILLTGGASKYFNINEIFQKNFDVKITEFILENQNLKFANQINAIDFKKYSQVMSTVFRSNLENTNSKINIRHGDLALISNYEKIVSEVAQYAKILSILIFVLLLTYFFRLYLFNSKINTMKISFQKDIEKVFNNSEPKQLRNISAVKNWDFDEYSDVALKLVSENKNEKIKKISSLSLNSAPIPLKILNEMSTLIPKTVPFEVVIFKYQEGLLQFEADTDTAQSVQIVLDKLKGATLLSQIVKKSELNKPGSEGQLIHFNVTAVVDTKGDL